MSTINEEWKAQLTRRMGPEGLFDLVKRVERDGLFRDWSRSSEPFMSFHLSCAIDILCGAPEQTELANTFLSWVRQKIERAKTEPQRWERDGLGGWGNEWKARRWYNFQRGDLFSRCLLGEAFVLEPRHFEALQGCAEEVAALKNSFWDEMSQSALIECALTAAAWGRLDMAQSIIKMRRSFKWTQRYAEWARNLIDQLAALPTGQTVAPDSALVAHFDSLFDEIRHPTLLLRTGEVAREAARRGEDISPTSWPLLRLSLAMLKQRYFLGKPEVVPGMRDLVALVSA
ncbi:hypothetical protein SAMN05518800_1862 [Variovorax sp. YR752]|uniref:hypothetical protein n=1 Tax=Variovorax sp. YR752 TaxID=1884383 RepID=UPI000BD1EEC9|nr:hypothetical protein [Variovorax sp. YR752]SOD25345.1 hypothetical protein SAMN05518800_1862 [Variovorax sp. YR752]